jgi:signal transduction histidine kinase
LFETNVSQENNDLGTQQEEAVVAGSVAHDFNNILTAITGYSELLLRRLDENDPNRRCVEEIHKAGIRAAALMRQFMAPPQSIETGATESSPPERSDA